MLEYLTAGAFIKVEPVRKSLFLAARAEFSVAVRLGIIVEMQNLAFEPVFRSRNNP